MPNDVELILMKQLASYLAMPIFLVDPAGTLLYYNEPAEALLGQRYDETGEMALDVWGKVFVPTDRDGTPLSPEELPLAVAVARAPARTRGDQHHRSRRRPPPPGDHRVPDRRPR